MSQWHAFATSMSYMLFFLCSPWMCWSTASCVVHYVCVCMCVCALHCLIVTGVQVNLSMSKAEVTCTNTRRLSRHTHQSIFFAWSLLVALPFSRLEKSVQQNSIKTSAHQAGNEWGGLRRSQPTDKEVLIDLVSLPLSLSLQLYHN